ncbi:hypothetical protein SARI_04627 [Salmonella enterica subsp. arizonae serovar 62:z4,z23:-]|uniref:Transposase n=1 Tax=Salmonella arizonae (strain ATCC BAA-731 / CDC346-86 / RSK2980) TaxID=41514 RepID=A9MRK0_SALAR|nr:hypothetical protein SARI_04627 [Salmonella enterica subsp. arizonae serovar 62:z4,z23:-]
MYQKISSMLIYSYGYVFRVKFTKSINHTRKTILHKIILNHSAL